MSSNDQVKYSVNELGAFLASKLDGKVDSPESVQQRFEENKITGLTFMKLTKDELRELLPVLGERKEVQQILDTFTDEKTSRYGKFTLKHQYQQENSTDLLHTFSLPKFSRKTQECIESSRISKGVRTDIVSALAYEIWRHVQYPTPEEYNEVCKRLVEKYPNLRDTIGNGYGSWKVQLRQKLRNMRRPVATGEKRSKPDDDSTEDSQGPTRKKQHITASANVPQSLISEKEDLEDELKKDKPDKKKVKREMRKTFAARRQWMTQACPQVSIILQVYPVFKKQSYLRRELQDIVKENGIEEDLDNIREALTALHRRVKMQVQLEIKHSRSIKTALEHLPDNEGDENLQDEYTVISLGKLLNPKTKGSIFHELHEEENVDEALERFPNEPFILKAEENQYYVVAEKCIIAQNTTFMDAMANLICTYFAFDIAYPKPLRPILIFIQRYIMGINDKQPIPHVITRVLANLDQHGAD